MVKMLKKLTDDEKKCLSDLWGEHMDRRSSLDGSPLSMKQSSVVFQAICNFLARRNGGECPHNVDRVVEGILYPDHSI